MGAPYALDSEHADFRAVVAEFAEQELAPHVAKWNAGHELPMDAVRQMADLGLFGLAGPEEFGGAGDFTSLCIAIEEVGRVDQSLGITLEAAVGLGINPLARFGTEEQKQRWLPDLLAGRALGAFALTEPESGSDAGALRTSAIPRRGFVGDQRGQAVHHELGHRDHVRDHRHRAHRNARQGESGDLDDHGSALDDGAHGRVELRQAGLARFRHAPAQLLRPTRAA